MLDTGVAKMYEFSVFHLHYVSDRGDLVVHFHTSEAQETLHKLRPNFAALYLGAMTDNY